MSAWTRVRDWLRGKKPRSAPVPAPTPLPVPSPTPVPLPPTLPPAPAPAGWVEPPPYRYRGYGQGAFEPTPQPAPHIYLVEEWSSINTEPCLLRTGQADWACKDGLGEDDEWDRHFVGYLEPGESAVITAPFNSFDAQDSLNHFGPGGSGGVWWLAASSSAVHGYTTNPQGVTLPWHVRPGLEHQEWASRSQNCSRDAYAVTITGEPLPMHGGIGHGLDLEDLKWPDHPRFGGRYTLTVTNEGTTRAGVIIRVYQQMAFYPQQVYFYPPEDRQIDIEPVDAPCLIDPRLPLPPHPVVDWNGYWYDGPYIGNDWTKPERYLTQNYP